jgi:hypothetical protein
MGNGSLMPALNASFWNRKKRKMVLRRMLKVYTLKAFSPSGAISHLYICMNISMYVHTCIDFLIPMSSMLFPNVHMHP